MIVLSHVQAATLLAAKDAGCDRVSVSLDLNLSVEKVPLGAEGVSLPDGGLLTWASVRALVKRQGSCYLIEAGQPEKIQFYSEATGRAYSLLATERAPTMLVAGFPMHRIRDIDPHEDTLRKMRTLAPISGAVLDTTTGLGYTALEAARTASRVLTIELDPTALEVARLNPWSAELYSFPNIESRIGNAFDAVPALPSASFARIFHDPPTFQLAGELYSGDFYRELHRVLQANGRLYHYIGDLNSAHGNTVSKGVIRRLGEAGFRRVTRHPEAFGVTADK